MKTRSIVDIVMHVAGIYVSSFLFGYYQESVTTRPYNGHRFRHYVFLMALQSLCGAVASFAILRKKQLRTRASLPLLADYLMCAVLKTVASQLGYKTAEHLTYTTALMAKLCKAGPVLVMNFVMYRKTYEKRRYVCALLLIAGVLLFSLGGHKKAEKGGAMHKKGILFLGLGLALDGAISSIQDNIFKHHQTNSFHMMLYLGIFSGAMSFAACASTGELAQATKFVARNPSVATDMAMLSLLHTFGQVCVYSMLERHGALALSTSGVMKKVLSILSSVVFFESKLQGMQKVGLLLIFSSLLIEILGSRKKKVKGA